MQIDRDVADQREQHIKARQRRCHRFRRAQQAVDCPGLASDFGGDPAGDDRHEADGRRDLGDREKAGEAVQPAAPAKPSADKDEAKHHDAAADHDPEGEEGDRDGRTLIGRKVLEALDLAVKLMGQDEAAKPRKIDGKAVALALCRPEWRTG